MLYSSVIFLLREGELLVADVGAVDGLETFGEFYGYLSVAGATVPGSVEIFSMRVEKVEYFLWRFGAVEGIIGGAGGEIVDDLFHRIKIRLIF